MALYNSIPVTCPQCGKVFVIEPNAIRRTNCCSRKCRWAYQTTTLEQKLAKFTKRVGQCLVWTGTKQPSGYGLVGYEGRTQRVHRAVWQRAHGPIPAGLIVMHSCDNPPCCELSHLSLGTNTDNVRDCIAKGRMPMGDKHHSRLHPETLPYGEKSPNAKLTDWDVIAIRLSFKSGLRSGRELASVFNVTPQCIHYIIHNRTWRHLL